jgi:hypothetical protein
MLLDLGDVKLNFELLVPGLVRYHPIRHYGVPRNTLPEDRTPRGRMERTPANTTMGVRMDLAADMKVTAELEWTDEVGNPTGTPADATATWSVDDSSVIALTDHGDGSAEFAAVGPLGTATVTVSASAGGKTFTGSDVINVVAGLAERVNVAFGDPEEVTPDDTEPEPVPEP